MAESSADAKPTLALQAELPDKDSATETGRLWMEQAKAGMSDSHGDIALTLLKAIGDCALEEACDLDDGDSSMDGVYVNMGKKADA